MCTNYFEALSIRSNARDAINDFIRSNESINLDSILGFSVLQLALIDYSRAIGVCSDCAHVSKHAPACLVKRISYFGVIDLPNQEIQYEGEEDSFYHTIHLLNGGLNL